MFNNLLKYGYNKLKNLTVNIIQGYITGVITDSISLWFSLLKFSENLSDKFIQIYVNPIISCFIGLGIGMCRFIVAPSKEHFKSLCVNSGISAINTSFITFYNYLKENILSNFSSELWNKFINFTTDTLNLIFRCGFTPNFVSIATVSILFNFAS